MSSYSGSIKTVVDRVYWELTGGANGGRCIDQLMAETLPNGQPKLRIVVQNRMDLPSGQFERIVIDDKIVGGTAYLNRSGARLDASLDIIVKEFYGGFHEAVFDYAGSASALTTIDWEEGISRAYGSKFMQYLQQQYGLNLKMKDTQQNRDFLAGLPNNWNANNDTAGTMALWAEVMGNAVWKQEVQQNGELSVATLQQVIYYFRGIADWAAYHGSNNFTAAVKQQVSDVLKTRVSATSDRVTSTASMSLP